MNRTSTVEVSIQAVLPVSRTGAASWAWPRAGASMGIRASAPRSTVSPRIPERITVVLLKYARWVPLDRLGAGFPGADAHGCGEPGDEDLAVAGAAGPRDVADRLDDLVDDRVLDCHLDPGPRVQIDAMRGAPIALDVPQLPAETEHLGHGHSLNADVRNGLPQVI